MVKCNEDNCNKRAIYGYEFRVPLKCPEHRIIPGMKNIYDILCEICNKVRPIFGLEIGKPTHCVTCKTPEMFNVKNKMCIKCNIKQPTFGLEGEKATYCSNCRSNDMIDLRHQKCLTCTKRPYFGLEIGKPIHCFDCKSDIMFDVLNKKCIKCNIKQPCYGLKYNSATHCFDCKTPEMNNVNNKLCIKCNIIQPSFGIEKNKPTHCTKCKESHMFNVISKLCIGCNQKNPSFGLDKNKPATHCLDCKTDKMFDTLHLQCKVCNNTRANPAYKDHCARCYGNLFPDSPIVRNFKTKERNVVDFIREQYPDLTWKFDKIVEDGCSRRRPDIYLDLGYQVIIIEVDENQHQGYENICENKRLMELSLDVGHRPIVFIRFNPHLASSTRCFATYYFFKLK
jgi:hypothetical protein